MKLEAAAEVTPHDVQTSADELASSDDLTKKRHWNIADWIYDGTAFTGGSTGWEYVYRRARRRRAGSGPAATTATRSCFRSSFTTGKPMKRSS
ncbi:MAG: hypothetical protein ACLUFV_01200 [Acutalibacteraceae bacterium]